MRPFSTATFPFIALSLAALALSACIGPPNARMGMVVDHDTNLMYGSAIEKSLLTDATFYTNRKLKVRTRNTSGDTAFDLNTFTQDLSAAYASKGYEPTDDEDFGLIMDVNVVYSGQVQTNEAASYSLVGGLLGGTYGGASARGKLTATVTGATLGNIIGRFDTQDTYIVIANVTFAVLKPYKLSNKRVTFSRSAKLKTIDDPNEDDKVIARKLKTTASTQVTVYAGGSRVHQSEIAKEVRKRAVRIVADVI